VNLGEEKPEPYSYVLLWWTLTELTELHSLFWSLMHIVKHNVTLSVGNIKNTYLILSWILQGHSSHSCWKWYWVQHLMLITENSLNHVIMVDRGATCPPPHTFWNVIFVPTSFIIAMWYKKPSTSMGDLSIVQCVYFELFPPSCKSKQSRNWLLFSWLM
jgi:hypothetical protein